MGIGGSSPISREHPSGYTSGGMYRFRSFPFKFDDVGDDDDDDDDGGAGYDAMLLRQTLKPQRHRFCAHPPTSQQASPRGCNWNEPVAFARCIPWHRALGKAGFHA